MPTEAKPLFKLVICHRPIKHPDKHGGDITLQHCYARLETEEGEIVESISYGGTNGVNQSLHAVHYPAKCQTLCKVTKQQWKQFQKKVYKKCRADNFSLKNNNCCSCLRRILKRQFNQIPQNIKRAQKQIAKVQKYVQL